MDFLGAPYPIKKTSRGLLATQSGLNQIKSDLLCLLMTNPGERLMMPTWGTPLRTLLFDPNDAALADTARDMIINSIETWEPRITIQSIDIGVATDEDLSPDDNGLVKDHILSIKIMFYDPQEIRQIEELVLELPLQGNA